LINTVEIEIYGQRYSLRGDADAEYVQRLASHVDQQMRDLAKGMKTATLAKLAVLAAINITHQLLEAERIRRQGEADVEQRASCLVDSIEEQLKVAPPLARSVRAN
jgi:cell division protein ZapA